MHAKLLFFPHQVVLPLKGWFQEYQRINDEEVFQSNGSMATRFFQKHHSHDCCKISRINAYNVSKQDQGAKTEAAWQLLEGLVNAWSLVSWVSTSLHKSLYFRYANHKYIAFVFSGMMGTCFPKMGNAAVLELPLARAVSAWNSGKHADVTKGAEQVITNILIFPNNNNNYRYPGAKREVEIA